MSQKLYFGNSSGKSVSPSSMYVGVNGVSKRVNKIYLGQQGKSVQIYPAVEDAWFAPGFYMVDRVHMQKILLDSSDIGEGVLFCTSPTSFPFASSAGEGQTTIKYGNGLDTPLCSYETSKVKDAWGGVIASSDPTEIDSAPDSVYFQADDHFQLCTDAHGVGKVSDAGVYGILSNVIRPAIAMGGYKINLQNLFIQPEYYSNKLVSELGRYGIYSQEIYFTYYCYEHINYFGRYIKLNITDWKLKDILSDEKSGDYVVPEGTIELGMFDCQEGAYKVFTYDLSEDFDQSRLDLHIWVPFNQTLQTKDYSWPEMFDATLFSDVSDPTKPGYYLKDRFRGILESYACTSLHSSLNPTSSAVSTWSNSSLPGNLGVGIFSYDVTGSITEGVVPQINYISRDNGMPIRRLTNVAQYVDLDRRATGIYLDWGVAFKSNIGVSNGDHPGEFYTYFYELRDSDEKSIDAEFDYTADPRSMAQEFKSPLYINHPYFCSMDSSAKLPVYHLGQLVCLPATTELNIYY